MRGVSEDVFYNLCENIKHFSKIKKPHCGFGVNYVINHQNYNQIYNSAIFLKHLGIEHVKFYPRVIHDIDEYHKDFKDTVISEINRAQSELQIDKFKIINKYEDGLRDCMREHRPYPRCYIMYLNPVIASDSKLYLCHDRAYSKNGIIGDLRNTTLKELWNSPNTQRQFNSFDIDKNCKYHCAYDHRNILIDEYMHLDDNNVNFI